MLEVVIINEQDRIEVDAALGDLVTRAAAFAYEEEVKTGRELPPEAEVSITFVDDSQIQTLNKQYRDIDQATDVLSFAMLEGESFPGSEEMTLPLGDIVN